MRSFKLALAVVLLTLPLKAAFLTIDEPVESRTLRQWDVLFGSLGFILSRPEIHDFIAAEDALAESLDYPRTASDGRPYLHGMTIRQIVLVGLALQSKDLERRIQKGKADLLDTRYELPKTSDEKKLKMREEFLVLATEEEKKMKRN